MALSGALRSLAQHGNAVAGARGLLRTAVGATTSLDSGLQFQAQRSASSHAENTNKFLLEVRLRFCNDLAARSLARRVAVQAHAMTHLLTREADCACPAATV